MSRWVYDRRGRGCRNFVTLHVLPGGATSSRLVVLHLEGFNAGANVGANSNFTYAIIPPAADADGDGLPDGWEWRFTQTLTNLAATADLDHDGMNNLAEYLADTDPLNAVSLLTITAATPATNGLRLDWKGGTDVVQFIEANTDLVGTNVWQVLATNLPPTAPAISAYLESTSAVRAIRLRTTR